MIDIVCPNGNEKEFIEIAKKLGYRRVVFLYPLNEFAKVKLDDKSGIDIEKAVLCKRNEVSKARKLAGLVIVKDDDARQSIERGPDIVFDVEGKDKDSLHFRRSGMNQVLCKIAKEKDVAMGFSFSRLLNLKDHDKALILGKIQQNISLFQKYKVKMAIATLATSPFEMRGAKDLISYFTVLGMKPEEAKAGLKLCDAIIKENMKKRDPNYLGDGIEIVS